MTVTNLLLLGLIISVVWWGGQILNRLPNPHILDGLPKPQNHKDFTFEECKYFVHFRIDALTENDFEVSFADGWSTGRSFMQTSAHELRQ